ncbi:Metallo-dependent hydrolase [Thozetella sp. PMI_491]|nr:Metallo-dependent hydrolase [Thozetella sp. PMI_491]
MSTHLALHGSIIHSLSSEETEVLHDALIIVGPNGEINDLCRDVPPNKVPQVLTAQGLDVQSTQLRYLARGEFLIPGFVDTHNHAPQWGQRGLGRGMHILDWLEAVTFKNEARLRDAEYARKLYNSCVDGFIKQGVTTACYYGSLHEEATKILADICLAKGQRAFVGKCCMNRNGATFYQDASAKESLRETENLISHIRSIDPSGDLVAPILTPRFAICCDDELLSGLGQIATREPGIAIQAHFNEAEQEIASTLSLFPQFTNEVDLYDHYNLLTRRSILAHCTHMHDYEIDKLKELDCGVAHCPISNTTVGGGFMAAPIRSFLQRDIKVGLGTDSGGGFSSSILDAMRQAFIVSNARELMTNGQDKNLSASECFYLATLGGARVCCLEEKIGNFKKGKKFDALLINTVDEMFAGSMTIVEDEDPLETIFEKFLMTGDDRSIANVWIQGRMVKGDHHV